MDARRGVPGASPSHRVEENFSVKVIFLDVDGTMNTMLEDVDTQSDCVVSDHPCGWHMGMYQLGNLMRIIRETEAIVVLISVLRKSPESRRWVFQVLHDLGSPQVAPEWTGVMWPRPVDGSNERPHEIQEWLDAHEGEVEEYVVIDDEDHSDHFGDRMLYCRTTHSHKVFRRGTDDPRLLGLTGELADRAIAILNSTIPRPQKRAPSP